MMMMVMMMMMMVKVMMMMMIVPAALRRSCNAWHQIVLQSFWVFTNALPRIGRHFWGHLPLRWMHRLMIGFTLHFNLFSNDECSLYVSHLLLVGSFWLPRWSQQRAPDVCVCVRVCACACVRAYVCVCVTMCTHMRLHFFVLCLLHFIFFSFSFTCLHRY